MWKSLSMKIPPHSADGSFNYAEWEAIRTEHVTSKEYLQAEEVAKQILELALQYKRGLLLADDYVAAVQRTVLV